MQHELIDIGVNLTGRQFNADRDAVIERALSAGVRRMVVTGTSEKASREAAALAASQPGVLYATAGVHPHDAKSCTDTTIPALRELLARDEVVAVGECGLDFDRDYSPRPVQERWFEAQLGLAIETGLPLFLHERGAHERFVEIVSRHRDRLGAVCVHCFTGTADELDAYLALDLHIGITGWICDERRGTHLRAIVDRIPADRLMIETDAPWLLPRDLRPKPKHRRNEPAFLPHIAAAVATATTTPLDQLAAQTSATAMAFFALPQRGPESTPAGRDS
jgi:TatD DNase family protein